MTQLFQFSGGGDENEYKEWLLNNPNGFVVNNFLRNFDSAWKDNSNERSLTLHKATCQLILDKSSTHSEYEKLCGLDEKYLIEKCDEMVGITPKKCKLKGRNCFI